MIKQSVGLEIRLLILIRLFIFIVKRMVNQNLVHLLLQLIKMIFLNCVKRNVFLIVKTDFIGQPVSLLRVREKIVDTEELRKLFDGSNARTITKDRLLTTFGVEPKGDTSTADVRDIHNMTFFIGRETMQKHGLMENNFSVVSQVNRFIRDFFTFDILTYVTVRCFRHKI